MADNRTVFKKIIDGDIPAKFIYQDEYCLAFKDIDPRAPTHILVIPRKEIRSLAEVEETDAALLGHLMVAISKIAREQGLGSQSRVGQGRATGSLLLCVLSASDPTNGPASHLAVPPLDVPVMSLPNRGLARRPG